MILLWVALSLCALVLTACVAVITWTVWASSDVGIHHRRQRALRRLR